MDNITNISTRNGSSLSQSPLQIFEEAINNLNKEDAFKCGNKALVIMLDDTAGDYMVSFINAGMKSSEMLSLLDISKSIIKEKMGY